MPALAGANLIYGLGMIESGMTFDFGQLVMDDEIARMIKTLESQMKLAAKALEFEKAAQLRDQVVELRRALVE